MVHKYSHPYYVFQSVNETASHFMPGGNKQIYRRLGRAKLAFNCILFRALQFIKRQNPINSATFYRYCDTDNVILVRVN